MIEIEGLPEGWKAVRIGKPIKGIDYVLNKPNEVEICWFNASAVYLIVQKTKPRRIVLEEDITDYRNPATAQTIKLSTGRIMHIFSPHAVREIKEE